MVTDAVCCGNQGRLTRVDLTTLKPIGTVASGFSAPRGVVVEPGKGTALVVDSGSCCSVSGTVTRVDLTTGVKTVVASGLSNPAGIVLEAGDTTALVSGGSQLLRINLTSGAVAPVGNVGGQAVSIEPSGLSALVASSFSLSRVNLATGSVSQIPVSQGWSGAGLVVESDDYALVTQNVCCTASGMLSRLNLSTGALQIIGSGLSSPSGIAIESSGNTVLVVEQGSCCILPGSPKITRLNLPASKIKPVFIGFSTAYSSAKGIAEESTGTALVVDSAGTLSRIDPTTGAVKRIDLKTGSVTSIFVSSLIQPVALTMESSGASALVIELGAQRVSRVNLTALTVTPVVYELGAPDAIVFESSGATALVLDSTLGRVLRLDISSGTLTLLASGLSAPSSVAIEWKGKGGALWFIMGAAPTCAILRRGNPDALCDFFHFEKSL